MLLGVLNDLCIFFSYMYCQPPVYVGTGCIVKGERERKWFKQNCKEKERERDMEKRKPANQLAK